MSANPVVLSAIGAARRAPAYDAHVEMVQLSTAQVLEAGQVVADARADLLAIEDVFNEEAEKMRNAIATGNLQGYNQPGYATVVFSQNPIDMAAASVHLRNAIAQCADPAVVNILISLSQALSL